MAEHEHEWRKKKCCCEKGDTGPQGVPGVQGTQGLQGVPGVDGAQGVKGDKGDKGDTGSQGIQGVAGATGAQGIPGAQGVPGPQGLQGVPGDCVECPCHCTSGIVEFAEVGSNNTQTLGVSPGANLPGGVALLEATIFNTPGIDVSMAAATGEVKALIAGWYELTYGVGGFINPIPSPLPAWSISIFRNGVYALGSTACALPISPEQQATEVVSDLLIHLNVNDVVYIANTSTQTLFLASPTLGTNSVPNSAFMVVKLLKAD
jgi:hypothetical protein